MNEPQAEQNIAEKLIVESEHHSVIEQEATKTGKRDGQPTGRVMPCSSEGQQHNLLDLFFHLYIHFITNLVLNKFGTKLNNLLDVTNYPCDSNYTGNNRDSK